MTVLSGFAIVIGLVAIGLIIFAGYIIFKSREDPKEGKAKIINFSSHKSEKRFEGIEQKSVKGADGRIKITYKPTDLNLNDLSMGKIKKKKTPVDIICEDNKIITIPAGELSMDKTHKFILPSRPTEFSEYLKSTILGRAFMWATAEKNAEKTIIDMLEEGELRREEILMKIGDGELTKDWINIIESRAKDSLKALVSTHSSRDKSPMPLGGPQHVKGP